MNLGLYQPYGVVNDLAPHDLSILLYWIDRPITMVSATGSTVFQTGVPETAFLTLSFENGPTANVQLSWLAPHKVRQMIVVGSKRMVVYDDVAADGAVRVYDRGFDFTEPKDFGEYQLTYRSGDMVAPRLDPAEPLGLELEDFAQAIKTGSRPRSDAGLGLAIVKILEAAHTSLSSSGQPVTLNVSASRRELANGDGSPAAANGDRGARDFTVARVARNGAKAA
jgi:predicted dehydrogenase